MRGHAFGHVALSDLKLIAHNRGSNATHKHQKLFRAVAEINISANANICRSNVNTSTQFLISTSS